MCGIVGYAGRQQAAPVLLEGLEKLEYRGYDSAGLCVHGDGEMRIVKSKGRIEVLRQKCAGGDLLQGFVGMGHTRWATHGAPSDVNSHPHLSNDGKIAVVHNGIIENDGVLRQLLKEKGIRLRSQTDTEVAANLIALHYAQTGDAVRAVRQAAGALEGSYALVIMCADLEGTLIGIKKGSPLIYGIGDDSRMLASDASAIRKNIKRMVHLDDGDMVVLDSVAASFYRQDGTPVEKTPEEFSFEFSAADLGDFPHYMLKELYEQPEALRRTIESMICDGKVRMNVRICSDKRLEKLRRIFFVACGSAYYVSLFGKYLIEKTCAIPAEAAVASEFRYSNAVLNDRDLVVLISQSGETADTLAALREAKRKGAYTLAVVNVAGSAIAEYADQVLFTAAGPEISVATTKAFSCQLACVCLLNLYLAEKLGSIDGAEYEEQISALRLLPDEIDRMLHSPLVRQCQSLAGWVAKRRDVYYIGRQLDTAIAMEGSLKLKEIAYIHSEAYPAGELKHGPISMIEKGSLVIALATDDVLFLKTMANIQEVKARGAEVICVTTEDRADAASQIAEHIIAISAKASFVRGNEAVIPLQLLAYYVAVERGCDVDKPRNLAKSVTVE